MSLLHSSSILAIEILCRILLVIVQSFLPLMILSCHSIYIFGGDIWTLLNLNYSVISIFTSLLVYIFLHLLCVCSIVIPFSTSFCSFHTFKVYVCSTIIIFPQSPLVVYEVVVCTHCCCTLLHLLMKYPLISLCLAQIVHILLLLTLVNECCSRQIMYPVIFLSILLFKSNLLTC